MTTIITSLLGMLALLLAALATWCARKALQCNASAKEGWAAQAADRQLAEHWFDEAMKARAQVVDLRPDADRWRIHIAACKRGGKTAAQRQRAPIHAMTARLREGQ